MEDYIEVIMPSDNPWIRGPIAKVALDEATRIADVAAETAESFRGKFKNAWQYDAPVFNAVQEMMPDDVYKQEAMYRAAGSILSKRAKYNDWHDGNYAAARCFKTRNAYATPGFFEALQNSAMYGS